MRSLLAGILTFAVALPVCAADKKKDPSAIGDRKVSGSLNFYSLEKEMAMGRQLAIEVGKQARFVDDPMVSEYVNRLGQNLVRNSDAAFPITFRVVESDEINAFTLPGGYVFINTGLIKLTANEAQLASALAHELGHAAARHATRQATRNDLISAGTLPLAIVGGWVGLAAREAAIATVPMAFFRFSREFETEADMLGLEYLWKAGYDPGASVDLFEAVESTERRQPGSVSQLFRSHPLTSDRIGKTQKNIDSLLPAREQYILNTSEYEEIRERLNGTAKRPAEAEASHPTLGRK
jgi:predicted Zn-dependent protease